ncbi:hypothetical protein ACKWTF_004244 [Chironomus riparius]
MHICIEGCAHGDLDMIYEELRIYEEQTQKKVDLLICCGDFQATRNKEDLACMAVPKKYLEMGGFYKYYTGLQVAPILTLFIGGNHEASNHLQELSYGGWCAPNIYYLGNAGVININGLKIAGVSGIYRHYNYRKGHYECPPYDDNTMRSVYAMRNLEVFRLRQLKPLTIDIMVSHDWPQKIWEHGDRTKRFGKVEGLLRKKPDFKADMDSGKLGNPPCWDLLTKLKPKYWYSAHMHCRFEAKVFHEEADAATDFVALDKCILGRHFLEFVEIGEPVERNEDGTAKLTMEYDPEWLTVLSLTNKFLNCTTSDTKLPYEPSQNQSRANEQRWNFSPTEEEVQAVLKKFNNDLTIKHNFKQTVNGYDPEWDGGNFNNLKMPDPSINIQTVEFCDKLGIDDPLLIVSNLNNVKVHVPNYTISDQEAFKDCNIVSDKQATATKKPQLSLPKPINNDEIDLDDLDDDIEDSEALKSTKSPQVKAEIRQEEKIEVQSELEEPTKVEEKVNIEEPAAKKFKRRNQDLYAATDE